MLSFSPAFHTLQLGPRFECHPRSPPTNVLSTHFPGQKDSRESSSTRYHHLHDNASQKGLEQVALSLIEHTPAQDKPASLGLPSNHAVKRVAILCVPDITPDVIGMAPPPNGIVADAKPSSTLSSADATTPSPATTSGATPAFPLDFARSAPENKLPVLSKLFSHGLPIRAEGEKPTRKPIHLSIIALLGEQSTTLESLLLTPSELAQGLEALLDTEDPSSSSSLLESSKPSPSLHRIANGWGLSRSPSVATSGWVQAPPPITSSSISGDEHPVVLALDCEMVNVRCKDGPGISDKALARIAVVDFWTEEVLMDELVKPEEEIVDYVTQ
ncbi:hypothetical protein DL93DRAFT_2174414 [Clavulina sp. PMI_390]|nr:hypothetical protein DL93DRAFT_2174414 [Clavulina sp. PMI_390]